MSELNALVKHIRSIISDRFYILVQRDSPESVEINDWKSLLTRTSIVATILFNEDGSLKSNVPWYVMPGSRRMIKKIVNTWPIQPPQLLPKE